MKDNEITKRPPRKILTLKNNKSTADQGQKPKENESATNKDLRNNSSQNRANNTLSANIAPFDFDAIYERLHSSFPKIINLAHPVLLAIGIKKEIAKAAGISIIVAKKWIVQYFYKSKYYKMHKIGAPRYDLNGQEAGVVTKLQQEDIDKRRKNNQLLPSKAGSLRKRL